MNILNDNYTQYISKDEKIIEFTDISNNVSLILAFIKSCCFSFLFFIFYISTIIEKTYNIKHFNKFEEAAVKTLTHCKDLSDAINAIRMYQFCLKKWNKIV